MQQIVIKKSLREKPKQNYPTAKSFYFFFPLLLFPQNKPHLCTGFFLLLLNLSLSVSFLLLLLLPPLNQTTDPLPVRARGPPPLHGAEAGRAQDGHPEALEPGQVRRELVHVGAGGEDLLQQLAGGGL